MQAISIEAVANIIGVHRSRIEQWISRNQFLPRIMFGKGKKREWDQAEVMRLAIFVSLVDNVGLTPADAGRLTQVGPHSFHGGGAYFVCYQVDPPLGLPIWSHEIIRKEKLGDFLASGCHIPTILAAGYDEETIRRNSEPNLGPANLAVVLNLDRIERIVVDAWPKEGSPSLGTE